ncbi:MAG: CCA tRNA nucleotidyltransferase [Clostridia bacterium]|nr:CCA tRNA nucleotidyltransferase [Clostridia bacterium]
MQIPKEIDEILRRLESAGYEAYLVGGCVRDRCMGKEPHDYDVTTSAFPNEMKRVFITERVIETGLKHGTLTVLTAIGGVEITTFRQEGSYSDHRHPDQVQFTRALKEDLARRDFTVNAMAMDRRGVIADPFGGQADLADGIIRCVGDPRRRVEEDALRILRGLRFSSRLGFAIAEETAAAMEEKAPLLHFIAQERIFSELCGLVLGKDCAAVLHRHRRVVQTVLPELSLDGALERLKGTPAKETLRFAALLMDSGEETAGVVLSRLKVPTAFRKEVLLFIRESPKPCEKTKKAVHARCARIGAEAFLKLAVFWGKDEFYAQTVAELKKEKACLSLKELAVDGKDIQALGYSGTAVGQALNILFEKVITEELPNQKELLLSYIKK